MKKYFPIKVSTKPASYKSGAGAFGSNRTGRKHAGCDLYAKVGTPVIASQDGIIRKISKPFYRNVDAVEITHETCIGRYCEISILESLKVGQSVKAGDIIGYVAKIDGISESMLHFELYDNQDDLLPLTNRNVQPYQRRTDLVNPTKYLDESEILL